MSSKSRSSELFAERLKHAGYSITKPRVRIYEVLSDNDALSMGELIKLVQPSMDRTSVYRTVDLFEKLGIVQRVHIGWKYKVELSQHFSHHHHHIACVTCGDVRMFEESSQLERDIHMLAKNLGYDLESHALELRGICSACK